MLTMLVVDIRNDFPISGLSLLLIVFLKLVSIEGNVYYVRLMRISSFYI